VSEAAAPAGFNRLLSDERLTRRAVGGDERAFAAIFRRYHQDLYRFCLAIVGNPEDAQDALQNTMIKVLRALPGEERRIELKPWLYRIAHNESIDLLRRRRETRQLDVEQAAPGCGLAEDAATRERLRRLIADLRELPERQREVLVMRELEGFDFEEIGAALETSAGVVRQTLYEARRSLRQMEGGREMDCEGVTRALSDGDGRVARRRDVRAHLRTCADCRRFGDEIKGRQRDFAALSPLPAVAATGMLQGLLGGSGAGSGGGLAAALGGGAAKTIGASAAAKGVATAAVVAAVGVTAADRSGVIHLGLPGDRGARAGQTAPGAVDAPPPAHPRWSEPSAGAGVAGDTGPAGNAKGKGAARGAGPGDAAPAAKGTGATRSNGQRAASDDASQAAGPSTEHANGRGQGRDRDSEEQPASAAAGEQEAAEGQKKSPPGKDDSGKKDGGSKESGKGGGSKESGTKGGGPKASGKKGGEPKKKEPKSDGAPEAPSQGPSGPDSPGSPSKETPANPPRGAAPNPPPQSQQPQEPPGQAPDAAPGASSGPGKGAEKRPPGAGPPDRSPAPRPAA
jgi:RNA polymerase sigma factor (sigma-70 family)